MTAQAIAIRPEQPADLDAIERVTVLAFAQAPHSSHTEPFIVNALRKAGALRVSLVAVRDEDVVGHVAASPVRISSGADGWFGIGPVSVVPEAQGQGIGSQLMEAALSALRQQGAAGCVLLGDPVFYSRFGFAVRDGLRLPGVPPEYFQALSFDGQWPVGDVAYDPAFEATA